MTPPALVIFDNDGVLVDSERLANTILADLLTRYGRPTTMAEAVTEHLGTSLARVRARTEAEGTVVPPTFEEEYHRRLFEAFDRELQAVPGVIEVVRSLGDQARCVASSGDHDRIRRSLTAVGLVDTFGDHLFSAEDVAQGKPAPDLFLHAAAAMGVSPAGCVVVEDSPLGVEAGRAAGMTTFAYAGLTPADRLAAADAVFTDMRELPAMLRA